MPKPVRIDKWCKCTGNQNYTDGNKTWTVSRLIDLAKDLEPFELPLEGLNLYGLCPKITTMRDFVGRIKQVLEADLSYPIILDDEGYIMDGRHRVAKALLEGKETILAVRFEDTPSPDYVKEGSEE